MTVDGQPAGSIGPYAVLRKLGEGGMGQVYLARSPGGRLVAVKTIREAFLSDPRFRDRFRREADLARQVGGAFTAAVVDFDADAPIPWLATAYVDAPTLAEVISTRGPLPGQAVRHLAAGLAEALASVHSAGVVHRDLKPSNILLAPDGPRLIDFGIARAVDSATQFQPGRRPVGSAGYISPERWLGQAATAVADMFSLGAVLCYAATGAGPFGFGQAEVIDARSAQMEPDLSGIADPLVRMIAAHCLARDPSLRPSPANVLAMLDGRMFVPGRGIVQPLGAKLRKPVLLSAVCVAASVALTLALTLPGSGTPGTGSGFAWSVTAGSKFYIGLWSGSSDVVLGDMLGGLTGYDTATGKTLWTWRPPRGGALCAMSQETDDGMGAFAYGNENNASPDCDHLQIASVATGHLGWSTPVSLSAVPGEAPSQASANALSIGGGVVSAAYFGTADAGNLGADTDLLAASVKTGQVRWSTDFGPNALANDCTLTGLAEAFAGTVYTLGACGGDGQVELLTVKGATRNDVHAVAPLGDCTVASESTLPGFFATDGAYLLIACSGESPSQGLYALKAGSSSPVTLLTSLAIAIDDDAGDSQAAPGGVVMNGNTLYLGSEQPATSSNSVTAFNLNSGAQLWSHPFPKTSDVIPLTATAQRVVVVAVYSTSATANLTSITRATGSPGTARALDAGEESAFNNLTMDVDAPYATMSGSSLAIGFPSAITSGATLVGVLPQP